ncbi:MAG: glycosyltransferase [Thermodesulfobacteriota bacterium]
MRVLHIAGFYPEIGGPYSVVRDLTRALFELGCKVGICSPLPNGYDKSKLDDYDHLDDLIYLESKNLISPAWPSFSQDWDKVVDLIRYYDLIHIHGIFDYYAYFVYRNINKPYIIAPHGSLLEEVVTKKSYFRKKVFLSLVGKKILNKAKSIHALTMREKASLENIGVDNRSISVIPNGINLDDFNDCPPKGLLFKKIPFLQSRKLVLFLSRIDWKKGLDDLIPAFSDVVKEIKDAHLILVGPDTNGYMIKVNSWIENYGLSNRISYLGPAYRNDKLMYMQDSDVFVLPSYSEAFPVAVIEAMYMGLPVIITENSGIPDVLRNLKAGLVINKTREEIASAIIRVLRDKASASEMGKNGKSTVQEKFIWSKIASKMIEFYAEALQR